MMSDKAMTPQIILPADTTVTVDDTLWWGVDGDTVPPEWWALTEACAACCPNGKKGSAGLKRQWSGKQWYVGRCPDCHEGRRTVEVERTPWPGEWDDVAPGTETPVPLGRAVIDGDWVPIVDWHGIWKRPAPCVERIGPNFHAFWSSTEQQQGQPITLHGYTDPGGYAARFRVVST